MNTSARMTFLAAALLFSLPAMSRNQCQVLSGEAAKAAQNYRSTVARINIACEKSFEECNASHAQAEQALSAVAKANDAMLSVCAYDDLKIDDSLPVSATTVSTAIDLIGESARFPCTDVSAFRIGCPNGWVVNIPRTGVTIKSATDTAFGYSFTASPSGWIPVSSRLGGTCTLTLSSATGVPVTGMATFFRITQDGHFNRLSLTVDAISDKSINLEGCDALSQAIAVVTPMILKAFSDSLSTTLCGTPGPELFGPCH